MLLRALRQPRAGRPSALARVVALLLVLGLVAVTAPVIIIPFLRWVTSLF